jgi:colanic acid biosynthesis glycosyl transferase WcaI
MKVLLLTQWYPPEPQKIVSDLAESLHEAGHEVTVLTGFPNFPSGNVYPGYRQSIYQREAYNGVPVVRVPLYPDHSRSALKRALNIASFAGSAALLGTWLTPNVDVIHVIHPPLTVALPSCWLSLLRRVPFTYEIQDMWPETLKATGMVHSEWAMRAIGWLARRVYRRAAAIRVISPGFRSNLIGKGVPKEKIHVISNWVDTEFYRPLPPDERRASELGLAGRFNILFAGMMGAAQGLENVIHAAAELVDLPEIQFVFLGDGNAITTLKEMVREKQLTNVCFLGRHPQEVMPEFFALADAFLLNLSNDPLFKITIPHKTFAYMSCAKPVLAAAEGDPANVITSAEAGFTCSPGDPKALAQIVRRLYALNNEERCRLGGNGRRAAVEQFSRTNIIQQVVRMLESVVWRGRKHPAFRENPTRP